MPCDAVRTVSLDFKVADLDILRSGLEAIGANVYQSGDALIVSMRTEGGYFTRSATIQGGKITVDERGAEGLVNEIKRAYSAEVIKTASKRYGWAIQMNPQNENKITATRR